MSSLQVVRIKSPSCPLPLSSHRQLATGPHWVSPRFHLSANLCEWPRRPLPWDRPHTVTAPSSQSSWERGESNQNHAGWAEIRLSIITKLSATSKGRGAGGKTVYHDWESCNYLRVTQMQSSGPSAPVVAASASWTVEKPRLLWDGHGDRGSHTLHMQDPDCAECQHLHLPPKLRCLHRSADG